MIKISRAGTVPLLAVLFLIFSGCRAGSTGTGAGTAAQPLQPKSGPGGADYKHEEIKTFHSGQGNEEYWIFEPSSPAPPEAPVVVFLHGWGGMTPQIYGAWITHLVRKGSIVIFPRYQESLGTKPSEMVPAAISAVRDALSVLSRPGHVKPRSDRMAYVGHSLGGVIAPDIAALAQKEGLPSPLAVMAVEPGDSSLANRNPGGNRQAQSIMGDYSTIPKDTLLICLVGSEDRTAGTQAAIAIFKTSTSIPGKNKIYITVNSDDHGAPALTANHFFPVAPDDNLQAPANAAPEDSSGSGGVRGRIRDRLKDRMQERKNQNGGDGRAVIDALDYFGAWRLFDALTDCAFYTRNCDAAIHDGPALRFMGKWSDGTPVRELTVTSNP